MGFLIIHCNLLFFYLFCPTLAVPVSQPLPKQFLHSATSSLLRVFGPKMLCKKRIVLKDRFRSRNITRVENFVRYAEVAQAFKQPFQQRTSNRQEGNWSIGKYYTAYNTFFCVRFGDEWTVSYALYAVKCCFVAGYSWTLICEGGLKDILLEHSSLFVFSRPHGILRLAHVETSVEWLFYLLRYLWL